MGTNNSVNISAAGLVKYDGAGAFAGVTVTQHDLLIGAASNGITSVAPSATSGVPVISQGASADPTFGTAVVAGGGTGDTSFTAYAPICGGTTTTGALQSTSTGISTSGFVLTSTGASSLPTFQAANGSGWVKLATVSGSASTQLQFTSVVSATYDNYAIVMNSVGTPQNLYVQLSSNNGSSYINTGYFSGITQIAYNATVSTQFGFGNTTSGFYVGLGGTSYVNSGVIYISGVTSSSFPIIVSGGSTNTNTTSNAQICTFGGMYPSGTAMNAIQLLSTSGNIASGKATLYGLVQ